MPSITEIAEQINANASQYRIGQLQNIRRELKGLQRTPSGIFAPANKSVNEAEGWAYHIGGREELQFNIGFEEEFNRFRFGVAFSLEPSRSFPSIDPLLPKIECFNEFVRIQASELSDYRMWIWHLKKIIKLDTSVRPISTEEIKKNNFIFLGKSLPIDSIDINKVLETFDELLPFYTFVESDHSHAVPNIPSLVCPPFSFQEGVNIGPDEATGLSPARTIDIKLRSNQIKRKLCESILKTEGLLATERPSGNGGVIDLVLQLPNGEFDFYEIKPSSLARNAIREALPQLLEYMLRPGGQVARKLIIASQATLDSDSDQFLSLLRDKGLPLYYQQVHL